MADPADLEIQGRVDDMLRTLATDLPGFRGVLEGQTIVDSGIDSAAFLNLLLSLETDFGIILDPEELDPSNFQDRKALASFVAKRVALRGGAA